MVVNKEEQIKMSEKELWKAREQNNWDFNEKFEKGRNLCLVLKTT